MGKLKLKANKVLNNNFFITLQAQVNLIQNTNKPTNQKFDSKKSKRLITPEQKEFFEILAKLNKKYPKVFLLEGPRPLLKIGIINDIFDALISLDMKLSKNKVKQFIKWYTFSKLYNQNHKPGSLRFDLDGNIVGSVTELEAIKKAKFFKKIYNK